jgi:hypothetical protein
VRFPASSDTRLPDSADTRLLLAGVVAVLALVAYLAVAFATTHVSVAASVSATVPSIAPWVPHDSRFVRIPRQGGGFAVRFSPAVKLGTYGGLVPSVVPDPKPGGRYAVSLSLRASRPGRIGVEVDEFAPGKTSVYVVETTVPVTGRWRHFNFRARVKGTWLGLGMYVYGETTRAPRTWFAVRGLNVSLLGS